MPNPASKLDPDGRLGGLDSAQKKPVSPVTELRLLRAIDEFERQVRDVNDVDRAARLLLRAAISLVNPDDACLATLRPGAPAAILSPAGSAAGQWDLNLLSAFAQGDRTDPVRGLALARLKRRARPWGTLALRWNAAEPDWDIRHSLTRLTAAANAAFETIEHRRLSEVRARIDRKIMEQVRPKDLFYQILDGLRSLTGYDLSGMLLLTSDESALAIAAEQIAWRKGKSARIGAAVSIADDARAVLATGKVWGFSRDGSKWSAWDPLAPAALAAWMDAGIPRAPHDEPAGAEAICAPLRSGDSLAGILRLSAQHRGTFGPYEAELVEAFLPQAMVAIQNTQRTEALQDKVIQSERKHAMAELARGVSHDLNNALGSILPLVQQLRDEADRGSLDTASLKQDLAHIERAVQSCTRIFGGMLRFARQSAHAAGPVATRVGHAVESAMAILGDGLRRAGANITIDIRPETLTVPLRQSELEQIFLNLISNARDSMVNKSERHLTVRARLHEDPHAGALVAIEVIDSGSGIPRSDLAQVFEPFYTTKPTGSGLGLSVCRSIIWQAQGRIFAESPPAEGLPAGCDGPGARIVVHLPRATEDPA